MQEDRPGALVKVESLRKYYPVRAGLSSFLSSEKRRFVHAVDDVSLEIKKSEIVGLIGESGSGKTTLGELAVRLQRPTAGRILFNGQDISLLKDKSLREFYRNVQMIFQDPYETLNPRFRTLTTLEEPLKIHFTLSQKERKENISDALKTVGLGPPDAFLDKYPHELSGGQRQRVAIARAIILNPTFIVADEPTSMLDVSIRAGILNLLRSFRQQLGVAILYVSHDLSTISYLCSKLAIMYLGRLIEIGPSDEVLERPLHPYTKALISAVPIADPRIKRKRIYVKEDIPDVLDLPQGCRFWPRCSDAMDVCMKEEPRLSKFEGRMVACHFFPGSALNTCLAD